jgi:hypothetical protein
VQVHVWLGQAQVSEERVRHPRVILLPGVNKHLLDTDLTERVDDGRCLHEVRAGTKHMRNQSLIAVLTERRC